MAYSKGLLRPRNCVFQTAVSLPNLPSLEFAIRPEEKATEKAFHVISKDSQTLSNNALF